MVASTIILNNRSYNLSLGIPASVLETFELFSNWMIIQLLQWVASMIILNSHSYNHSDIWLFSNWMFTKLLQQLQEQGFKMFILVIILPYVHTNVNMIARANILKPHSCDHTKYHCNPAAISTEGFQHGLLMMGYLMVFHNGGISNHYNGKPASATELYCVIVWWCHLNSFSRSLVSVARHR